MTASHSSALMVQTEYTMVPPAFTRAAAARSRSSWSSGRGSARQRRSGRAFRTPSPEHGASTSARSKSTSSSGSARPSATTTRTFFAPTRRTASSSSRARASFTSTATTSPSKHRRLAAGRGADVEGSLSLARSDGEPGELRAPALGPDAPFGNRGLVDPIHVPRARNVLVRALRRARLAAAGRRAPEARSPPT